jgi:hypothetical protein
MGGTRATYGKEKKPHSHFWFGNLKEKASTCKTCVNGSIIDVKYIEQEGVH